MDTQTTLVQLDTHPIVPILQEGDKITVLGRDLHKALELKEKYTEWVTRMVEYGGFIENIDFTIFLENQKNDTVISRPRTNHQMTIDMAKEIAMLQRSDVGRRVRRYFIEAERKYRSTQRSQALELTEKFKQGDSGAAADWLTNMAAVMSRAAELLNEERQKTRLLETKLASLQPKVNYVDVVLNHPGLITTTVIAKDYGYTTVKFNQLLHNLKVVYKQSGIWHLYAEYARQGWCKDKTTYQDGTGCVVIHNYWTQKGRLGLYEFLKSHNIFPLIEQEAIDQERDELESQLNNE